MKEKLIARFTSRPARIALPLSILVVGLLLTGSQARLSKTIYTASARLWIPTKIYSLAKDAEVGGAADSALTSGPQALKTACEIIHSDAVTKLAYDDLQKKLGDQCPSADAIQGGVRARPVESTDVLDLSYSGTSADSALTVLQSVIDAFFKENNIQVTEPLHERKERLEQQLKLAQSEYSKVKLKVKNFQDSTSFIDMQSDVQTLTQQKQDLEKTLEESKHELSSLKSRLDYAQKQLGFGPESVVAVQKLAEDEIMRSLRSHIAETEVALIGLRSKYQDEHPKVKRLKASLEEAQKGLDARYMQIVGKPGLKDVVVSSGSTGNSSGTTGSATDGASKGIGGGISESAQARMISEMAESSTTIASLNAKIASLSSSLGAVRSKLASVPARQMELADIHRADDLATNSLSTIERELQKVYLSESAGSTSSRSMQLIDDPTISGSSTPNLWMFGGGLSVFLAVLAAAAQFLCLPRTFTANKLATVFPARLAGLIPAIENSRNSAKALSASVDRIRHSMNEWFTDPTTPIVVTSGSKGDGKSTTIYALAVCLADAGTKVLLIDGDTITPAIHRMASISASPGLLQYLDEAGSEPFEYMQAVRENLTVIPAGGVSEHSCLNDARLKKLVGESSKHFEVILIDSPECGDSLDSLVAPQFECCWLAIVRLKHSLERHVQNLATQLEMLPMDNAVVVNSVAQKDINILRASGRAAAGPAAVVSKKDLVAETDSSEAAVW